MKKLLLFLSLAVLLALVLGGTAGAQSRTLTSSAETVAGTVAGTFGPLWVSIADPVAPAVNTMDPASAANDLGTPVTITGTGFALDVATGTIPPAVTLGSTPLTDVTFVDPTTLTATVPYGMDTGPYTLTVTNPDGGAGSLPGAFVVRPGIGKWNGGNLFGGQVNQILMKPGDPDTLYAPAYRIHGLFRSTDAGEHWAYAGADLPLGNGILAVDPFTPTGSTPAPTRACSSRRTRATPGPRSCRTSGRTGVIGPPPRWSPRRTMRESSSSPRTTTGASRPRGALSASSSPRTVGRPGRSSQTLRASAS